MSRAKRPVLAISMMAFLMASGSAALASKRLVIMQSVPNLANAFFSYVAKEITAEAAKLGDIEVIATDGQNSSPKQTADIENAIAKEVDGIIIAPNEVDAMVPALQKALDARIPIVTIDRRVDKVPGVLAHVGAHNVKGGELQGDFIVRLFPRPFDVKVVSLLGTAGSNLAIDRARGLHNVLDKVQDRFKIVFEDAADFNRAKARTVTETALGGMSSPPDVIVAANDEMALGALDALKERGLDGKVALIGFDAIAEALDAIETDKMTATIDLRIGEQGRSAVDTLVSFLREGKKPDASVILVDPIVVTKENLNQIRLQNAIK